MKKFLSLLFVLVATVSVHSQNQTQKGFEEDLEYLAKALPQKHVNLFAKISRSEFESKIAFIKSKIDSLDEDAFLNELFKLMVAVGDEHTRVEPQAMYRYILPLQFASFKEGIFVVATDSAHADLLLAKVLNVNGMPINDVLNKFKTIIPNDNSSYFISLALYYLGNVSILKGADILSSKEEANYTFENTKGEIRNASFKLSDAHKMVRVTQPLQSDAHSGSGNYWYKYDPVHHSLYFNYVNCKDDAQYPFERFTSELFESIASNKPEKIILDLRYNGGGNSKMLAPFLHKIKNSYLNKKGCFYVLIGKTTFSSALLNAIDLKRNFNTILVGEATAGSINHYGETRSFELPNTQAAVIYSTKYFEEWKGKNGPLHPDVEIGYSVENFKNGKDEALEYIYQKELTY